MLATKPQKPSCLDGGVGEGVLLKEHQFRGGGTEGLLVSRENTFWILSLAKADHSKGPTPLNPLGDFLAF